MGMVRGQFSRGKAKQILLQKQKKLQLKSSIF
jgi:hypothetical protein